MRLINSGHRGLLLTAHADIDGIVDAFYNNLQLSNKDADKNVIQDMLDKSIDVFIYLNKNKGKRFIEYVNSKDSSFVKEFRELNNHFSGDINNYEYDTNDKYLISIINYLSYNTDVVVKDKIIMREIIKLSKRKKVPLDSLRKLFTPTISRSSYSRYKTDLIIENK